MTFCFYCEKAIRPEDPTERFVAISTFVVAHKRCVDQMRELGRKVDALNIELPAEWG